MPEFEPVPATVFSVSASVNLVLNQQTGEVTRTDADTGRLFASLRGRRSIEEHAVAAWGQSSLGDPSKWPGMFQELFEAGLLIEASTAATSNRVGGPADTVDVVAMVTADRPTVLKRGLVSLCAQLDKHGRRPRVLVIDGSNDKHNARECLETARIAGRRHSVQYVGRREAELLTNRLRSNDASPSGLTHGLMPGTIGSNRNLASLLSAGERLLMIDDDVLCDVWQSPNVRGTKLQLTGHGEYREWTFCESRASVLEFAQRADEDLLQWHGRFLGRGVVELVLEATERVSASLACSHLLRALSEGQGRIRVTMAGLAGDSALHCHGRLLFVGGTVSQRLGLATADLERALASREMCRIAPDVQVTHDASCMAYCMGLSNEVLSPPFMPAGRNEDGVFGAMLAFIDRDALYVNLPVGIIHDPPNRSVQACYRPTSATVCRLSEYVLALLRMAAIGTVSDSQEKRLLRIGAWLQECAAMDAREFTCMIREAVLAARCQELSRAQAQAVNAGYSELWRRTLDEYEREFVASATDGRLFGVEERESVGVVDDEPQGIQECVGVFGELIEVWPCLWRNALTHHEELTAITHLV